MAAKKKLNSSKKKTTAQPRAQRIKPVPEPDGLNAKQIGFCQQYLIDNNATQSAIRAGYSQKTAGSQAHDLLKKPEIRAYIQELKANQALRTSITADRVLAEYARIAFADIRDVYNPDGSLKSPRQLSDDAAHALSSIKRKELAGDELEVVEVKLHDKLRALDTLAKHLDLVGADVNVTLPVTGITWEVVDSPKQ